MPLLMKAKICVIANKYDIRGLKDLAKEKCEKVVASEWNSASFVASLKLLSKETMDSDRCLKDIAIGATGGMSRN